MTTAPPVPRRLRVAIVTNVVPSYHQGFYDRLLQRDDVDFTVFCQSSLPGVNVRAIHERYAGHVHLVQALGLSGERLAWQFLPWRPLARSYDVVFVAGNPRNLSHALLATWLRLRRRPVVLWTMAASYRAVQLTMRLRLAWTRIFPYLLVYTDRETEHLRRLGFRRQHVLGINNGLDQERIDRAAASWTPDRLRSWVAEQGLDGRTIILSVARLEPKNRFDMLVDALPAVIAAHPDAIWCVVGDGREDEALRRRVAERGLDAHVRFVGPIFEEERLAPWFLSASLAVHPAAIGLGLLHAFGYGVPLITHGNAETHGPEFAAFVPGETGLAYEEGSVESLAVTVTAALADRHRIARIGAQAREVARTSYNSAVMVQRFMAIARRAAARQSAP
jgi:glycosyltransferase involved in cell wall biosynthesis